MASLYVKINEEIVLGKVKNSIADYQEDHLNKIYKSIIDNWTQDGCSFLSLSLKIGEDQTVSFFLYHNNIENGKISFNENRKIVIDAVFKIDIKPEYLESALQNDWYIRIITGDELPELDYLIEKENFRGRKLSLTPISGTFIKVETETKIRGEITIVTNYKLNLTASKKLKDL